MKTLVIALGLMLATVASASAALVVEGEIPDPTAVDFIYFTVESTQVVTIDILSREEIGWHTAAGNELIDLNGDGEITLLDTFIHLFPNLATLTPADVIASNDDAGLLLGTADGSTSPHDSFLELTLNAGDYALALGAYDLSVENAILGVNPEGIMFGDYRVTITGAIAYVEPIIDDPNDDPVIPEPATVALIGLGLTGLAAFRRRRTH